MTRISETAEHWFGLCRKAPTFRTAPALLMAPPETMLADRPDSSGSGRIRHGVSIATGSLKTMVRNRYLLVFSFLSGLAMFFLIVAKVWDVQQFDDSLPFLINIPLGTSFVVFDPWLFLVELICMSCFTILLAGLVLQRNGNEVKKTVTFREGLTGAGTRIGPLAVMSFAMALIATMAFGIISGIEFFGDIVINIQMPIIEIPDAYIPYGDVMAFFYSFILLFINTILFLVTLCLVPVIVLKKTGPVPVLAGLISLIRRTGHEMLGCILVYGTIIVGVTAVALVIGQLPRMLYQGYSYHATVLTHPLMTVVYYGFILACSIIMAAGFTAAGVAIADLYHVGKSNGISGIPEGSLKKPEHAS
ncbi:MAG: hypothetical protein LUQ71_02955 [Methanoregula sp.]|nr:hypothetical protein [Methanoregula sp.]